MGLALDSPIPSPILDDIARTADLRDARLIVLDAGLESNQRT
jgi:hypothetical protein